MPVLVVGLSIQNVCVCI